MIWDSNSSNMEDPNANEMEQAMGFHISTTTMWGISKKVHRRILGQVMDINCVTWLFCLIL
jgi:hypothetical protein